MIYEFDLFFQMEIEEQIVVWRPRSIGMLHLNYIGNVDIHELNVERDVLYHDLELRTNRMNNEMRARFAMAAYHGKQLLKQFKDRKVLCIEYK